MSRPTAFPRPARALALGVVLLLVAAEALAVNYFSRNGGTWSGNNRWSTVGCGGASAGNVEPDGADDTATICNGHTITLDASYTIGQLTVNAGGQLSMSNANADRTLTVSTASSLAGSVTNAGTIRFTNNNNQTLTVATTLGNTGTIDATAAVTGTKLIDVTGAITNSGTITFAGAGTMTIQTDSSLNNSNVITATANTSSTKTLSIGTSLTNSGTITLGGITNAMSVTVGTTVGNTGTIQGATAANNTNAKNLTVGGLFTNNAGAFLRVLSNTGTFTANLDGGLNNSGTVEASSAVTDGIKSVNVAGLTNNASGVITFGGNTNAMTIAVTGAVNNSGTIDVLSSSTSTKLLSMTTTLTNSGTISIGGTTNPMSVTVGTTTSNSGTIQGVAADTNAKNFTSTGLFTNSTAGSILRVQGATGTFTVNLNGGLTNSGTVDGGAGGSDGIKAINVAGNVLNNGTGTIQFGGNINAMSIVLSAGGTLTNSGTINALAASTSTKTLTVPGLITNNAGGVIRFGGATNVMTINANAGLSNAGTFDVDTASNLNHVLNLPAGDIVNTGTLDLAPDTDSLVTANFTDAAANQTISGAGGTTRFYRVILTKGTKARILEVTANNFSLLAAGSVHIDTGTFKLSAGVTIDPFSNAPDADSGTAGNQALPNGSNGYVLRGNARLWINHASAVVNVSVGAATDYNLTLAGGTFQLTAGTVNIGDAQDTRLRLDTGTANSNPVNPELANASTFLMGETGAAPVLVVSGRLTSVATTDIANFQFDSGTITLATVGNNIVTFGPFFMSNGAGSVFRMTGGTMIIRRVSLNVANEYDVRSPVVTVTGGTVQIGDASTPGGQTFQINSSAAPIWNLVVNAQTTTKTAQLAASQNIANSLLIDTGSTLDANNQDITIGSTSDAGAVGTWTNNGTFTPGTATVTFQGANSGSSIGGSVATNTFNLLTINKSAGNVALSTHVRVTGATLTLTSGDLVSANPNTPPGPSTSIVVLSTATTTAGASSASYVTGCVRKEYAAAAAGSFTFPIGDSTSYTPVTQTWNATAGANGDVTACVFASDHPQVTTLSPTTVIDKNLSVNRYWTLTANLGGTGTPTGAYGTSFTYVSADNDGTGYANYVIQRYDGAAWQPSAVSGVPTATNAATTNAQTTAYGAYAIGEPIAGLTPGNPGRFNAFETTTPAGAIIGKVFTKVSATSGSVAIVAINSAKSGLQSGPVFTGSVNVWVIDASNNAGALDANGCRSSWLFRGTATAVSPFPGSPPAADTSTTFVGGDNSRRTLTFTFPANAYQQMRLMMRDAASGALIGCSNDVFALRPAGIELEALDADWQSAGTARSLNNTSATGGNVHAASTSSAGSPRPFTLRTTGRDGLSAATTNYNGSATVKAGPTCVLPAGCATGSLTPAVLGWGAATLGVRTASAHYSEVGTFTLELEDATYAAVDLVDGTPAATYTIPQLSGALQIGRFVPAYFDVTTNNTPQLQTFGSSCASRSFTYVGQAFGFVTPPVAMVTARNAAGATTTNYQGSLWKISTAGPSDITQTYSNNAVGPNLDTALANNAPTVDSSAANGTGTVTVNAADRIAYVRDTGTPIVPYTANVSLTISVRDDAESGVTGNPAQITSTGTALFNGGGSGIAFDSGAQFRYGRLRLQNATGSEKLDLNVPLTAQYYTASGFTTNTADSCTSLANANYTFLASSYSGTLSAANLPNSRIQGAGTLAAGIGSLKILKPTASVSGSVTLCIDLDPGASGDLACQAATPGDKSWLQGPWGSGTYTRDPPARLSFGVYGSQPRNFIFFRENY